MIFWSSNKIISRVNFIPRNVIKRQISQCIRFSSTKEAWKKSSAQQGDVFMYVCSIMMFSFGLAYASVPLYQMLCSETGIDGTPKTLDSGSFFDPNTMVPLRKERKIKVTFSSTVSEKLGWCFEPSQRHVTVVPGEAALAFFKAINISNKSITGISTYSISPAKAAQYFNKIQCFCFENQKLLPNEDVDMPVFFYIDPEFAKDPRMNDVTDIVLHYTFFKSKDQ